MIPSSCSHSSRSLLPDLPGGGAAGFCHWGCFVWKKEETCQPPAVHNHKQTHFQVTPLNPFQREWKGRGLNNLLSRYFLQNLNPAFQSFVVRDTVVDVIADRRHNLSSPFAADRWILQLDVCDRVFGRFRRDFDPAHCSVANRGVVQQHGFELGGSNLVSKVEKRGELG